MTRRQIAYEWLRINEEKIQHLGRVKKYRLFNKHYPDLYSEGGFKSLLEDVENGKTNVDNISTDVVPGSRAKRKAGDTYKVLIFSDCHGWLADLKALRCINKVLQANKFDEVCINGDVVDLPYLSKHTQRLFPDGILKGYTEVGEIEYTRDQILKPLRASTDALIRVRIGNHDERITKPNYLGDKQLQRLALLYKHFETTKLEDMLSLTEGEGYLYDPSDVHTYFDMFDVVHGLSLTKNAPEKNIQEFMSSGISGHTHRLHAYPKTNKKNPYVWLESGCTRLTEQVEYFPTGKIADWQQGFVCLTFVRREGKWFFHWECVQIINGFCMYNGEFYSG